MSRTLKKTIRLPQLVALYVGAVLGSGVLLVFYKKKEQMMATL